MKILRLPQCYAGYPQIDRVVMDHADPSGKPRRTLRFWYMTQSLPSRLHRDDLIDVLMELSGHDRHYIQQIIREGHGLYWQDDTRRWVVEIHPPEEVHRRLGLPPPGPRQYRPFVALALPPGPFHTHLVKENFRALLLQALAPDGGETDGEPTPRKLTKTGLAQQLKLSRRTIQRLLPNGSDLDMPERLDLCAALIPGTALYPPRILPVRSFPQPAAPHDPETEEPLEAEEWEATEAYGGWGRS